MKTITYTYDAVGNRLTQNDTGTLTNYTYDNANRLTNVNAQVYTWDNNGNPSALLRAGSAERWDECVHVRPGESVISRQSTVNSFAYNGLGDRLSQTVGVTTTRYALDPAAGLTQVLSDGTSTYLYGAGRIAQQQTNMQYFGADGLGSVRQLYNTSGQIIANHRFDPFGNTISQSGVGTSNYGFTGEWTDATGLEYLRARYYAPGQGRFVTKDVWPGDYNAPLTLNAWNYVNGNPVNFTDPRGHAPQNPGDPDDMPGDCGTPWCWENRWYAAHGYNWDGGTGTWIMPVTPNPRFYDLAITDAVLAEGGVRLCGGACLYLGGTLWGWGQKKVVARAISIFGGKLINEGGIPYLAKLLGGGVDVYLDSPSAPWWCSYACAPPIPLAGWGQSIFLTTGVMNSPTGYMDVVHELAHIVDWHSRIGGRRFSDAWQGRPLTQYAREGTLQPAECFAEAVSVWVFNTPTGSTYRNALLRSVDTAELAAQMDRMEALLKGWY